MHADGYGWVCMGVPWYRGTNAQRNKGNRAKNKQVGHVFCPYGRGNFPGHDVLWVSAKRVKYWCRWMIMDADGCNAAYNVRGGHKQVFRLPVFVGLYQ